MKYDQELETKKRAQPDTRLDNKKEAGTNKQTRRNAKCERCGRDHETKDCPQITGACFRCGKQGHLIANCPKRISQEQSQDKQRDGRGVFNQPPKIQGRLYNMTGEGANNETDENPLY